MVRGFLAMLLAGTLTVPLWADDKSNAKATDKGKAKDEVKTPKIGRPGELTPEEEDKLDAIITAFIRYDIGQSKDKRALTEFEKLGPEAIPALIRGLNQSATLSHSCPVVVISKKLKTLLQASDDPTVLTFARENIGSGVRRSPYTGLLNELKFECMTRKAAVDRSGGGTIGRATIPATDLPGLSPGEKSPGEKKPK